MAPDLDNPLERYQVMDPLGRGGTGHTFRGIDRATNRQVAIKVLSLRDLPDWKRFDLFEREAAVLGTLDHPGIPRYIDRYASEASGDYFLVMELVEGTPLSRRMAEGKRLSPSELRGVLEQGLAILEYLHGLSPPVIHRDIKPANLLLDPQGTLHLVDFGGVRLAARSEGNSTMIGSFGYMAPEQLHGEATTATDLYALGATIAALHAGVEADRLPHDGLHVDLDALELPPALAPALRRMLEPDPKARVRTVPEVRALLRQPSAPRPAPRPAPPRTDLPVPIDPPPDSLVPVDAIRTLANVPAPLSVLVWIVSALATGGLTVFQVILLPLVYRIAQAVTRSAPPERHARMHDEFRDLEHSVARARRSFKHVARHTNPIRDDDDDPKPR
ncbi:MAG: serine/threonine protein kinase [Myxococcales bacterium]|nr:serine/threonine protein kinase [Myxococcales bacterium]MCB9717684.1 serine/threonine protein kinase [Myxococcales bacterium]